jgi:uncharacterized protein
MSASATSHTPATGGTLDAEIARVLADYPEIAAAWVFGSLARGTARSDSDLDVGVLYRARGKTVADVYRDLASIAARLEGLVASRKVDVVLLESQGPIFCHAVLREGRLVYDADPERRVDFESDTYVRYFDFLPTYEIATRNAVRGMRDWLEKRR